MGLFVEPSHAWICLLPCLPLHVEWFKTVPLSGLVRVEVDTAPGVKASYRPVVLWSEEQVRQVFGPSSKEYEEAVMYFQRKEDAEIWRDEGC